MPRELTPHVSRPPFLAPAGPTISRKLRIAKVALRSRRQTTLNARAYVERLEALIEVPIRWVSFGPHREQLVER
jgi:Adenylosuccinate synthetase